MPLSTTRDLMATAAAAGTGLAAFNVITLEHAEGIVAGATAAGRPVILQISENAVRFHGGHLRPIALGAAAVAAGADVPVSLHLDHVESADLMHDIEGTDISSVMFDGSKLDYEANVAATRDAADWAHARGLYIEAELGEVGGKGGAHAAGARTDPTEAAAFVAATGVDALAVAVGSTHAMTTREARLDHDLIAAIHAALAVPLVLHGSSGVPDDELASAIRSGMTKINIGTILNVAYTGAVRRALDANATLVDPRKYLAPARTGMAEVVAHLAGVLAAT
jgi:fructose-bisphosphate aldolase, class II